MSTILTSKHVFMHTNVTQIRCIAYVFVKRKKEISSLNIPSPLTAYFRLDSIHFETNKLIVMECCNNTYQNLRF